MQNLDNLIQTKIYYQIQLNNDEYIIKKLCQGSEIGDIVLLENFGCDNKYSLYICVYEKYELELLDYIPVARLTDGTHNYYICFKTNKIEFETISKNFELYFIHGIKFKNIFKIDKNINSKNIIEIIVEKLMDLNIYIF